MRKLWFWQHGVKTVMSDMIGSWIWQYRSLGRFVYEIDYLYCSIKWNCGGECSFSYTLMLFNFGYEISMCRAPHIIILVLWQLRSLWLCSWLIKWQFTTLLQCRFYWSWPSYLLVPKCKRSSKKVMLLFCIGKSVQNTDLLSSCKCQILCLFELVDFRFCD